MELLHHLREESIHTLLDGSDELLLSLNVGFVGEELVIGGVEDLLMVLKGEVLDPSMDH